MSNVIQVQTSATPVLALGGAYTSGDNVGGLLLFTNAFVTPKVAGECRKAQITDAAAQAADMDLILFGDNPSASTFTDNAAQAIAAADRSKIIAIVSITTHCTLSGSSISYRSSIADAVRSTCGGNLYGCLVTRSTPTYVGASDLTVLLDIIQD